MEEGWQIQFSKLFQNQPVSLNGYSLYKADIVCLCAKQCLRSETIGCLIDIIYRRTSQVSYQNLIKYVRLIDTFVVTMIALYEQPETLAHLQAQDYFNSDTKYLLLPVNTDTKKGSHWFLLLLRNPLYKARTPAEKLDQHILSIYDSVNQSNSYQTAKKISCRLTTMIEMFHKVKTNIKVQEASQIPSQNNDYDCGVFVVGYAEMIVQAAKMELLGKKTYGNQQLWAMVADSTEQRNRYRQMLMKELIERKSTDISSQ